MAWHVVVGCDCEKPSPLARVHVHTTSRPSAAAAAALPGTSANLTTAIHQSGRKYSTMRSAVPRFRPNTAPDMEHLGPGYVVPELKSSYVSIASASRRRARLVCRS